MVQQQRIELRHCQIFRGPEDATASTGSSSYICRRCHTKGSTNTKTNASSVSLLSCCRPQRIALIFTCLWVSSISPVVSARPFALNLDRLEQAIESLYARVAATLQSHTGGTSGDEQAPFAPILLDCGSSVDYTDSKGNVWKADAHYSAASESYLECPTDLSTVAVDAEIYCSDRWFNRFAAQEGPLGYEIPMSLGSYTVTLHFSETFFAEQNQRVFDVAMENGANRTIDIVKDAGGSQRAYTVSEEVQVTDGFLSIEFFSVVENPKISAIEVYASTTSMPPTTPAGVATYVPGLLTVEQDGLILSEGLTARILAVSNAPATYHNGQNSTINVHTDPDAGACFPDLRPGNEGGWIYVSNSEAKPAENSTDTPGGVGAFTFDSSGNLIDYNMVLEGTIANCGGGKTPWGAWISGEERKDGMIWQVDPTGEREPAILTMSNPNPGMFESFAYDARNTSTPRFFMSKDDTYGEFRRFTPTDPDWNDPWDMLLRDGVLDYLVVEPDEADISIGTYYWTSDKDAAQQSTRQYFPNVEGIDARGDELFFVSKLYKTMFVLNLDEGTYANYTTTMGLFSGQPDQISRLVDHEDPTVEDAEILYFTEDGGQYAGLHARNAQSQFFTILESHVYADETTGLAFSPDFMHLYLAYQDNGILFAFQRSDGLPFNANTLDVKFHNTDTA